MKRAGIPMIRPMTPLATHPVSLWVHSTRSLAGRLPDLREFVMSSGPTALSRDPAWLQVLANALHHDVYALEARINDRTCGYLPLAHVSSVLFGRFLVSLPYLNSNGVMAESPDVQSLLVSRAVELADEFGTRHLELRQETHIDHPQLTGVAMSKVHMRKDLPKTTKLLWDNYDTKVRNQIRKGEKADLSIVWGRHELLKDFYTVICHNMRDLGTPVYGRELFSTILDTFPQQAEICVIRSGEQPIAAALTLHGPGVTEVPTASSLREFNPTCCNMLMYHHLQTRAVEKSQQIFDFGRSTAGGSTFKFKRQWGAVAHPAIWQYYSRKGQISDMRPDNPQYQRMIRLWQKLPVRVTRYLGPRIVRGIP